MRAGSGTKERGGAKIKLVLTLLFMGSVIFVCAKTFPAYFADYQLHDSIKTEAQFAAAGYHPKSAENIRDDVWAKMQELGIPAQRDDIVVNVSNSTVDITVDYTVTFDLAVTQFTHEFHTHADNHSI